MLCLLSACCARSTGIESVDWDGNAFKKSDADNKFPAAMLIVLVIRKLPSGFCIWGPRVIACLGLLTALRGSTTLPAGLAFGAALAFGAELGCNKTAPSQALHNWACNGQLHHACLVHRQLHQAARQSMPCCNVCRGNVCRHKQVRSEHVI